VISAAASLTATLDSNLVRRTVLLLSITAIVAACALGGASQSRADGDPASDILVTQTLFMPWDTGISTQAQAQLADTITAANKAGFPIRVAVIASPSDLGTETALWRKPGMYGDFLGTELSDLYSGQLLVVMPNGYGLHGPAGGAHKLRKAEIAVTTQAPGTGDHMAATAITAVQLLAAADGHRFTTAPTAVRTGPTATTGSHWVTWLALVLGILAILAAWTASLRSRPLTRRTGATA
jgi:hypothetical protein